jgi:hypothetical protein
MTEPTASPAQELKTYHGNCHCGAVKFTVKAPENLEVSQCNCSICFKKGYKYLNVGSGDLNFIRGEEHLKDYGFGEKTVIHRVYGFILFESGGN